jgi:hypothetical protein
MGFAPPWTSGRGVDAGTKRKCQSEEAASGLPAQPRRLPIGDAAAPIPVAKHLSCSRPPPRCTIKMMQDAPCCTALRDLTCLGVRARPFHHHAASLLRPLRLPETCETVVNRHGTMHAPFSRSGNSRESTQHRGFKRWEHKDTVGDMHRPPL